MTNSYTIELIIYAIYCGLVIPLGIMVNKKLYQNVKNEEHLEKGKIIQKIMKTHSFTQCIVWPILMLTAFALKMNKVALDMIPHEVVGYIIVILRSISTLNGCYGGFNSLIIAISRYTCIVYEAAVEAFGVRKLRKLLITSSIGIPIFFAILHESLIPVENVLGAYFMPNYTYSYDKSDEQSTKANDYIQQSPLFVITDAYLPISIKYGLKLVWFVILILVHSNVLEGIIYLHTYIFYHRYYYSGNKLYYFYTT